MSFFFSKPVSLQKRRSIYIATVVAATILFLFFFNFGSYLLIKRMGGFLELELDRRLQASAMLIKTQIEKDLTNLDDETNLALLQSSLLRVLRSNDLQGAYLIDEYLTVITDARNTWDFENRSYLQQDSLFIHSAFAGNTSVSPLYTIEGSHFKNVYTLVQDLQGQSAVLVLEANADFLIY